MSLSLYLKTSAETKVFLTSDVFIGESISVSHKLMTVPTIEFSIPTEVLMDQRVPDARFEFVLVYDNGHIFHGRVDTIDIESMSGVTAISASHIAVELESRRVPTNYAVKELTLGEIFTYDSYIRPAGLGEGEIISNQKGSSTPTADGPTKTGNKTVETTTVAEGHKRKVTTYEMSDGTTRQVVSDIVREAYGKNNYKQTTTTTRPDGSVTQTVTTKNGYGSTKTEVTSTLRDKDPNKNEDEIVQQYVDISKLDGMFNDPEWTYKFVDDCDDVVITYLFSNQNKLQALTDICRQTEGVFWRISLTEERTIEIGRFGEYKQLMINEYNLMGDSLRTVKDFTTIINYGIYFTDKSDSGTTTLTLRDVYNRPELQNPKFPVILTGQEVNTERNYNYIDLIPFGSNNNWDYAVLDTEGLALEAGEVFEGAFTSNDVQTVANTNKELTNEDRLIASRQLYTQAVRKLIHSRRKVGYPLQIAELPANYNVGDKVRLSFVDELLKITKCSKYFKKLLTVDDYFYITEIVETIHTGGMITYTVTVEKFIYNDMEV